MMWQFKENFNDMTACSKTWPVPVKCTYTCTPIHVDVTPITVITAKCSTEEICEIILSSGSILWTAIRLNRKKIVQAYQKKSVNRLHFVIRACTLSREKVLVTAKLHPASNARRIIAELVVGVAEARPNGFSNLRPHISTLMSTRSTGVKNFGSWGSAEMNRPWRDWGEGRKGGREKRREREREREREGESIDHHFVNCTDQLITTITSVYITNNSPFDINKSFPNCLWLSLSSPSSPIPIPLTIPHSHSTTSPTSPAGTCAWTRPPVSHHWPTPQLC